MTSTLQPGLMQVLSWPEWLMMACVFGLLILAGWVVFRFFRAIWSL